MTSSKLSPAQTSVRFSRVVRLHIAVALGICFSVGLGVAGLPSILAQEFSAGSVSLAYLMAGLAAIPLVLTYAERAAVISGSGGVYNLARRSGTVWQTYFTGWLLLFGQVALVALLGWTAAIHLNLLFSIYFSYSANLALIATALVGLVTLNLLLEKTWGWESRSRFIYFGVGFLVFMVFLFSINSSSVSTYNVWTARISRTGFTLSTFLMTGMWGLYFILNVRDEIHRPTRTIFQSMLLTVLLGSGIGVMFGFFIDRYPVSVTENLLWQSLTVYLVPEYVSLLVTIYGLSILIVSLIALNQVIGSNVLVAGSMIRDGFLPVQLQRISHKYKTPILILIPPVLFSILMLHRVSPEMIVGIAAATFLWASALVHISDALRPKLLLPEQRFPKLPFHPLFPWLSVAVGLIMPIALSWSTLLANLAWVAVGGLVYVIYARRRGLEVRRRETVVGKESATKPMATIAYTVMVGVSNPKYASSLIQTAAAIAQARGGQLRILKILTMAEHIPVHIRQQDAQRDWAELTDIAKQVVPETLSAEVLVRLSPDVTDGILEAVHEANVNMLLLGWPHPTRPDDHNTDLRLNKILSGIEGEVAIIQGELPGLASQITVPVAQGPHARAALSLGKDLSTAGQSRITAIHLVADELTVERENEARQELQQAVDPLQNGHAIDVRVIPVSAVTDGILTQAKQTDLLLLGASQEEFLKQAYLGDIPATVAQQSAAPVIITKAQDTERRSFWLRMWSQLSSILPTLTVARQAEVLQNMRLAAQPTVDFFVLITLAAAIAMLGLLQNSAAVIIGAMLVAPLMSPILAMAMAMVHGDLRMLVTAVEATVKGVTMAIIVGVIITIISPLNTATTEIMARTSPNLLDLLVALASGAAAGYALSRKEVAAALPGVAIAAALVPPLCVVGYGIGTTALSIAGGALLLFITNLIAIVLAAALVFLALGFHPAPTERGELLRGLKVTLASLAVVSLILAVSTIVSVVQINRQIRVEQVFTDQIAGRTAELVKSTIVREGNHFRIDAVVISLGENLITPQEAREIEAELEKAVGGPVDVNLTVLTGSQTELEGMDRRLQLRNLFRGEVVQLGGLANTVTVSVVENGYRIDATIISYQEEPITYDDMTAVQENLSETMEAPVAIRSTILPGQLLRVDAPTPTPEP